MLVQIAMINANWFPIFYLFDNELNLIKGFPISSKDNAHFLIDKKVIPENEKDIYSGYSIVGDFLDKTIIKPNNKSFPSSRNDFTNLLK